MTGGSPIEESEVELIDYLNVLWKWKWLIVIGTLACLLVGGLITMLLPKTYRIAATIDTGDLSEERSKDVERLVARLNAGSFLQDLDGWRQTGPSALTAQFKKPFLIDLRVEAERPPEGVKLLELTANAVMGELGRLRKEQQEQDRARLDSIQTEIEAAKQELKSLAVRLKTHFDRRAQVERLNLDSTRAEQRRLAQYRILIQKRIEELQASLDQLQKARAEALGRATNPTAVLVFTQLSNEIVQKETALSELQNQLTGKLPTRLEELETRERRLSDQIEALEAAGVVLRQGKIVNSPQEFRKLREAIYAGLASGSLDVDFVESALGKVGVPLPEKLRTLERQADELARTAAAVRPARLLSSPVIPRAPVSPRLKLNLAVGFVLGLMGSVMVAFFVEYLQKVGGRR